MNSVSFLQKKEFIRLYKFVFIGGLGIATNLILFFMMVECFKSPEIPVSVFCYFFSATQNYFANHYWTFNSITSKSAPSLCAWVKFLAGSCIGLIINLLTLYFTSGVFSHLFFSQLLGLALAFFANYAISVFFVFNQKAKV